MTTDAKKNKRGSSQLDVQRRKLTPMISYAQNFEDVLLRRALADIEPGYFIDVGAFHPVIDNVSFWFYSQGWTGINVEPQPSFYAKLCEVRPHDLNLQMAVAGSSGAIELHLFDGLSTTVGTVADHHRDLGRSGNGVLRVQAISLDELFERYCGSRTIDFLKIDVEGAEGDILLNHHFTRHRPRIIVVEATQPDEIEQTAAAWEQALVGQRYLGCYFDGLNRYYVREEDAWRANLFDAPPNVFDQFRLPFTDRRVDYRDSLRAVADLAPQGGIDGLLHERDRLAAEYGRVAAAADALRLERDEARSCLRSASLGHDAALRHEQRQFADILQAVVSEQEAIAQRLADQHSATVLDLEERHQAQIEALEERHEKIGAATTASHKANMAELHHYYEQLLDQRLVAGARLDIKLMAARLSQATN